MFGDFVQCTFLQHILSLKKKKKKKADGFQCAQSQNLVMLTKYQISNKYLFHTSNHYIGFIWKFQKLGAASFCIANQTLKLNESIPKSW